MINGLLTLRGAWNKVAEDPVLKVLRGRRHVLRHVDVRGPAAQRQVGQRARALHRLDHRPRPRARSDGTGSSPRHALLARPRLFQTKLHSQKLAEVHFWIGTFGILYATAIYSAGISRA